MNKIHKLIESMTYEQKHEIIYNYQELQEKACIGDCLLRKEAENLVEAKYGNSVMFVMRDIYVATLEYFYKMYTNEIQN